LPVRGQWLIRYIDPEKFPAAERANHHAISADFCFAYSRANKAVTSHTVKVETWPNLILIQMFYNFPDLIRVRCEKSLLRCNEPGDATVKAFVGRLATGP
jgi:hypothetical protein